MDESVYNIRASIQTKNIIITTPNFWYSDITGVTPRVSLRARGDSYSPQPTAIPRQRGVGWGSNWVPACLQQLQEQLFPSVMRPYGWRHAGTDQFLGPLRPYHRVPFRLCPSRFGLELCGKGTGRWPAERYALRADNKHLSVHFRADVCCLSFSGNRNVETTFGRALRAFQRFFNDQRYKNNYSFPAQK